MVILCALREVKDLFSGWFVGKVYELRLNAHLIREGLIKVILGLVDLLWVEHQGLQGPYLPQYSTPLFAFHRVFKTYVNQDSQSLSRP